MNALASFFLAVFLLGATDLCSQDLPSQDLSSRGRDVRAKADKQEPKGKMSAAQFRAFERRIELARKSGRMSDEDAKKRLDAARARLPKSELAKIDKDGLAEKQAAVLDALAAQLQQAVDVGLLKKDEVAGLLQKAKQRLGSRPEPKQGDGAKADALDAWAENVMEETKRALLAGKITSQEAASRVRAVQERLAKRDKAAGKKKQKPAPASITQADYDRIAKRIQQMVTNGQLSAVEAERKLVELRERIR